MKSTGFDFALTKLLNRNMSGGFEIFITALIIGGLAELIFVVIHDFIVGKPFRINHKLSIGKKLCILSLPIWGLVGLLLVRSDKMVLLFMYSAIFGPILEYGLGKFAQRVYGIKLWTYKHGSIGRGETSIYTIPYWGAVGLLFSFLMRLVGI